IRRARKSDLSLRQHIDVIRISDCEWQLLLHKQNRNPAAFDFVHDPAELPYPLRSETLRRLVHEEKFWIAEQRAGAGEHLLLATTQRSTRLMLAFQQNRKKLIDTLEGPFRQTWLKYRPYAEFEIFADRQGWKNAPSLWNE